MSENKSDIQQPGCRKLVLRSLTVPAGDGGEMRADLPDTKLTVIVVKTNDIDSPTLQSIQNAFQDQIPDRKVIVLACSPGDEIEILQEN